jgi:hypothetical protein
MWSGDFCASIGYRDHWFGDDPEVTEVTGNRLTRVTLGE